MSELEFNKILEKFNFNKDNWEFDIEFDCVGKVILKGKFNEELILELLGKGIIKSDDMGYKICSKRNLIYFLMVIYGYSADSFKEENIRKIINKINYELLQQCGVNMSTYDWMKQDCKAGEIKSYFESKFADRPSTHIDFDSSRFSGKTTSFNAYFDSINKTLDSGLGSQLYEFDKIVNPFSNRDISIGPDDTFFDNVDIDLQLNLDFNNPRSRVMEMKITDINTGNYVIYSRIANGFLSHLEYKTKKRNVAVTYSCFVDDDKKELDDNYGVVLYIRSRGIDESYMIKYNITSNVISYWFGDSSYFRENVLVANVNDSKLIFLNGMMSYINEYARQVTYNNISEEAKSKYKVKKKNS